MLEDGYDRLVVRLVGCGGWLVGCGGWLVAGGRVAGGGRAAGGGYLRWAC